MRGYKVKGKIDPAGHLIITEPIAMAPGDVEVIILQSPVESAANPAQTPHLSPTNGMPEVTEKPFVGVIPPPAQPVADSSRSHNSIASSKQVDCEIPGLKQWLEQSPPVPADYDPEQAKWEYLKEKHNL